MTESPAAWGVREGFTEEGTFELGLGESIGVC